MAAPRRSWAHRGNDAPASTRETGYWVVTLATGTDHEAEDRDPGCDQAGYS